MLALGLASVPFFNVIYDKWTNVYVDLPKVESDSPIYVFPKSRRLIEAPEEYKTESEEVITGKLIQNRNLSIYDKGKSFSNCFSLIRFKECGNNSIKARKFIFNHWKSKKRGYIIYSWNGIDAYGETYIFIEPDESGKWNIFLRSTGDFRYFTDVEETKVYSIKYKRATRDDYSFDIGTYYLSFIDEKGEEVFGL